jgi:hypothetical protein
MKRLLSVRSAIAALALITAIVGFVAVFPETEAFAGICTYYSGPNYRTVVGQRGTDCCGEPVNWGVVTAYRRCEQVYCVWCPPPTE